MSEETKHKILIVEDDEMVRSFVTIHLENKGFDVSGVATGKAFFAAMEKEPVDLIILDLNLPDGDGLEFAAEFRKSNNTPIIIASARKGMDDRLTALNMGSIDYVTKPFDPQELFLQIRNLLNIVDTDNENVKVEPASDTPTLKYLAIGSGVAMLVIVIAGAGWYFGKSTPPTAATDKPAIKHEVVKKQETPPPVVQVAPAPLRPRANHSKRELNQSKLLKRRQPRRSRKSWRNVTGYQRSIGGEIRTIYLSEHMYSANIQAIGFLILTAGIAGLINWSISKSENRVRSPAVVS